MEHSLTTGNGLCSPSSGILQGGVIALYGHAKQHHTGQCIEYAGNATELNKSLQGTHQISMHGQNLTWPVSRVGSALASVSYLLSGVGQSQVTQDRGFESQQILHLYIITFSFIWVACVPLDSPSSHLYFIQLSGCNFSNKHLFFYFLYIISVYIRPEVYSITLMLTSLL